ncbi:tRNA cyclic N6-threonylcarbamoyladenosine(37) synthase TcdA [Clostridium thermosuccinogenes]|jgi:tRNA A37 threonylcarbamoyladenosine dehydratase|uniref:tRNA cyclic N6-threonylcarbamoyladenosine(37) synthase TcdA n=1 Tax=Clostridium thermosuccinogenes TaxID=84032 RepID=A0A2K2F1S8_9CLOT|nr:tRNA threonylcarbamoyladenosine dehydratase [Pseudoclostridium thermosuccinogenes]AUS96609.1 tRNA cyclic N6-threonylcarbamoyladenosine(37) synthase TcdA [Pseudoclostridium thermosuccinogenes]PNT92730.1 tRNA cyclic N6-threonylcarbamoyladenosine(37) synthase TcdA [Pseudoclostridium thermosuccinogenes]PNT94936.1 tRNA cyclic N6-threonylcarbamoyladenosine(37) synthase TcdA [Pseudoclostridium thermosuccinogenes]PNT95582.1 tRNA cyclic N6-threonylcarbamoyladenosine(37) synthase TcdA [Pseudoclostridi
MLHAFSRIEMLIGAEALKKLNESKVAVFGVGGVGSYVVEGLVRSGVGKFVLVDDDCVCLTNINRQLHATRKTIGKAKVEVMRDRILEINPKAEVTVYQEFYMPDTAEGLIKDDYDYIVDAIDTVTGKIDLVVRAKAKGIPIISCMGAGNKLDPTKFEVADIYETSVDPLAKVMRKELRSRGVDSLKVVYSREVPLKPLESDTTSCKVGCVCPPGTQRKCTIRHQVPGSAAFVPSVAGLIIAGEVVKDLIKS